MTKDELDITKKPMTKDELDITTKAMTKDDELNITTKPMTIMDGFPQNDSKTFFGQTVTLKNKMKLTGVG